MAGDKLAKRVESEGDLNELISALEKDVSTRATENDLGKRDPRSTRNILSERQLQRWILFVFAIGMAVLSFLLIAGLVIVQAWMRIHSSDPDFELLSGRQLEILSVSVFTHILGIILIIARKVWDDTHYRHFYEGKQSLLRATRTKRSSGS